MLRRSRQSTPEEVLRASAERLLKSKSPFDRFAGRVALLEPIEFHWMDTVFGGSLNGYNRWTFAHLQAMHRERSVEKDVTRHLWVGKKVGQIMLSVNFFGLSDGVLYNAQLRRLPYHKHAVFYGDRNGIYGDIELLDEAAQMAKDIEVGLMIQEHRVIQEFRSLAETSRDDP